MNPTRDIMAQMANSPYPPSFQGSGWAYAFAVFSLLIISIVGAGTVSLAFRNLIRRKLWTLDWWQHVAFMLAGIGATCRCAADAAYKMAWGQTSVHTLEMLMAIKNAIDSVIAIPVIAWMAIYALKISTIDNSRHRVLRFGGVVGLVAAVSAICAFTKV